MTSEFEEVWDDANDFLFENDDLCIFVKNVKCRFYHSDNGNYGIIIYPYSYNNDRESDSDDDTPDEVYGHIKTLSQLRSMNLMFTFLQSRKECFECGKVLFEAPMLNKNEDGNCNINHRAFKLGENPYCKDCFFSNWGTKPQECCICTDDKRKFVKIFDCDHEICKKCCAKCTQSNVKVCPLCRAERK